MSSVALFQYPMDYGELMRLQTVRQRRLAVVARAMIVCAIAYEYEGHERSELFNRFG